MKKIIISLALIVSAGAAFAQGRTANTGTAPGSSQVRPSYPATLPGTNTTSNSGTYTGTAPQTSYPGTSTPYPGTTNTYPGTNTSTQPGISTPGTGTAPRPGATTATPFRTYSDKNNLISNNPNPTPASPNPAVGNPTINGR